MRISLLIATRNRCAQLRRCLESISHLECKADWELLVVDNGSTDGTESVVREFIDLAICPTKLIKMAQPGKARSLNKLIPHAQGDILAITDDDCYPRQDFLQQILNVFEDPEIGFMGGRVLLYDPGDARVTIREGTEVLEIPPRSFVPAGLIHGANMAFRRKVIEQIGGFDPLFGVGGCFGSAEDVEFQARASAGGWKGGYFPGPVVFHHHGRKPGAAIRALRRGYAHGGGAYFAKFILNRQTRLLYAKHWWWQTKWQFRGVFLRELLGASHYCLVRLAQWARPSQTLDASPVDRFSRSDSDTSRPVAS